jgi:hypothetical protein
MGKDISGGLVRKVLVINGIGDIVVGALLLFVPRWLGSLSGLAPDRTGVYLAGGWGIAALSFGLLRLFAGLHPNPALGWFVAIFGLVEGVVLTSYGLFYVATSRLTLGQVSFSTAFAFFFGLAYGAAFILRRRERPMASNE